MAPFASPVTTVSPTVRAAFFIGLLLGIVVGFLSGLTLVFALSEHMWGWAALGFGGIVVAIGAFLYGRRNTRLCEIANTFVS